MGATPIPAHATLRLEAVLCGKAGCSSREHGPYWYAYWKDEGRLRKAYVGRKLPARFATPERRAAESAGQQGLPKKSARLARLPKKTPAAAPEVPLEDFAASVKSAARDVFGAGRFGRDKVFIAAVWRAARRSGRIGKRLTLDAFKGELWRAHREGLLELSRADLTSAMPPGLVQESELRTHGGLAHFHFVYV